MINNKVFYVNIRIGTELTLGLVRADTFDEATVYIKREYPESHIELVQESALVLL